MIAFDTDVLTEILQGDDVFVARASVIPVAEQAVPIIVLEEILRGRLNIVRQAEAGKAKISLERAYQLLQDVLNDFRQVKVLPYTSQAESLYHQWQQQKIRVSPHDLRIAAICVTHDATLISRNRRDFQRVPGLMVEFWA